MSISGSDWKSEVCPGGSFPDSPGWFLTNYLLLFNIVQNCTISLTELLMSLTKSKTMIHRLPLTEVRNNLGKVVRRANVNNEMFILEKGGIPVAALMNIDDLEDYIELQDPKMKKQIAEGYQEYLAGKTRPVEELLAELKPEHTKPNRKKK